jgi:hypothetical protein
LWLTDAYFVATSPYVQALRAAARGRRRRASARAGASDIPALSPLSRCAYRPLLEAGVRVFEWNGTMLHAKTAVADRRWSRCRIDEPQSRELDVELRARRRYRGPTFAEQMASQYEADLARSTEIVLTTQPRAAVPEAEAVRARGSARLAAAPSAARAAPAAGAFSVGSALGAALTDRRILGPAEAGLLFLMAGRRDRHRRIGRACGRARSRGRLRSSRCGRASHGWQRAFRPPRQARAVRASSSSRTRCPGRFHRRGGAVTPKVKPQPTRERAARSRCLKESDTGCAPRCYAGIKPSPIDRRYP